MVCPLGAHVLPESVDEVWQDAVGVVGFEADPIVNVKARVWPGEHRACIILREQLPAHEIPVVYDEPRVVERYGVRADQLRDLKALVGDSSDGIPGVSGVGLKSASQLLQRFESLDGIYANLDRVESARLRNALQAGRESALLSRSLVQLRDDAPVQLDLEAARLANYDRGAAVRAIRDLGFETLATRVPEF